MPVQPTDLRDAAERIRPHILRTPIHTCRGLDELCTAGAEPPRLFLKCETFQRTGSFKARGATNAVLRLCEERPDDARAGVATHSSGNHGAALAWAAGRAFDGAGIPCTVVMPVDAPAAKRAAVESYLARNPAGGRVIECGPSVADREAVADEVRATGARLIHPSDDPHIIAGQGTWALELLEEEPDLDAILVPIGGGGL
ncbi:MAG: pyridoxal-phosphate dependent enzyme, partial [Planctomycetota bacterium]